MNESHRFRSLRRTSPHWKYLVGFLGVILAVLLGRPLVDAWREQAKAPPSQVTLPPPPEEVAKPHLDCAEQEAERGIGEQVTILDTFFADAKKGTPKFAAEALSWSSKWQLVAGYIPFTDRDRHHKFIRSKFEEHVFSADQLELVVKQVVQSYMAHIDSVEGKMLVALRADVADFPTKYPIAQMDEQQLRDSFGQALSCAMAAVGGDLRADVGTQLASIIAGEVITQVAVRLGVSAGILGTGAASSWATLGITLVVGLIVDQLVSWVWDWWADPKGNLAAELDKKLNEMNQLIVDGSTDVEGLRDRLHRIARDRAKARRAAVLSLLHGTPGEAK